MNDDKYCLEVGCTLKSYVRSMDAPMSENQIKYLIEPVMDSLNRLHQEKIIYGNINPDNLIFDENGKLNLIDFGIIKKNFDSGISLLAESEQGYRSLEQYKSFLQQGSWTDVYSVCAVIYFMITHAAPPSPPERLGGWDLLSLKELGMDVSDDFSGAVQKGLSLYPEQRFQSMRELKEALFYKNIYMEKFDWMDKRAYHGTAVYDAEKPSDHASLGKYELPKISACPSPQPGKSDNQRDVVDLDSIVNSMSPCPDAAPSSRSYDAALPQSDEDSQPDEDFQSVRYKGSKSSRSPLKSLVQEAADTLTSAVGKIINRKKEVKEPENLTEMPQRTEEIPEEKDSGAALEIKKVQFSALVQKLLTKGEYSLIDIVMYENTFRKVVDELIAEAEKPVKEATSGKLSVADRAVVKIQFTSPDIDIADNEEEYVWEGEYLKFSFGVFVPEDYAKKQIFFTATVFINGMIATKLKFVAKCDLPWEQKLQITRDDILSAFISYASQDRRRVVAIIQGMKKVRPDMDIFFDIDSLRSGEEWKNKLYQEIADRDVLFLCWSHFARESKWVESEWKYALNSKGIEAIEPIPLEPPNLCPPPAELASIHFNDALLYISNI